MSNSLNISNCKVGQNDLRKDCKLSSNRQSMFKDFSSDTKFTFSKCVLSCCRSCSFCLFPRATAKERFKSLYTKEKNKRCERCFLCKSMSFCPTCSKCPQCCPKFGCRGQTAKVLASLAQSGGESKGGLDFTRGIHATLQNQTTSDPIPGDQEWLCSPRQKQSLVSGGNRPHKQVGSRKGHHQILPGLLQPPLSGAKTESEMETYLGPQPSQSLFETRHLQNGNSGNNKVVSPKGGVGNVTGFQRRLLSYPYQSKITKVPQVFSRKKSLSIHGPSFRARHSSSGIHQGSQGGETDGSSTGYPDPPVPRRLVSQSPGPGNLPITYPDPLGPVPRTRVGGKHGEIGAYTSTGFQFRRLPVRPAVRSSVAHSGPMDRSSAETTVYQRQGLLFSPAVHVPHRATYCHGKASVGRPASHETGAVASKKTLACAGEPGKHYSGSPFSSPTPGMVAGRDQCAKRATLAPSSARPTDFYRRLKRRLGCTLRGIHSKRRLVRNRKSPPHQLLGTQGSSSGSQEFREAVQGTDCPHSNRQHDCNVLHQQRGRYEIRVSLCPTLAASSLVSSQEDNSAGQTHSGSLECHSRQAVPAQPGDPDRVVLVSTGVQSLVLQLGPAADRSFCHPIQPQASQVCLSSSGFDSLGGGCSQSTMEQPGRVRLSSSLPSQSGHIQTGQSGLSQNDLNRSGLAQHALVLGSDQSIKSNSLQSSLGEEPVNSTVQRPSPQELESSESACLAPRASSIRRQGFSEEVAARIEAPQRSSTRAVYKSKWAIFVKWCDSNQVDFRAPSLKQVADFLLYLFNERQLQPSTIEGYRTAIADMVGNDPVHFGKDESLTRLLDSFHRDKPKGRRGIPAWNLSLVLHQLTKAPFEPMRKASLKHLTFKTVFLLALGSGKRRSEIHAWLYRNIRHQENWSQVSLYPSPSFLSKNQLARDGPSAVAPVVIPALAPSLDRSLKEDKSLCPVRALRYYLDRTKDLRSGKDLVFVSFRKSFQKDIVPATVSSWIKQTVLLCYQLSDHEAQNIHQVRAHDMRAFAASKAFQGGVSLDQILSACHWKAHNTFTQFYLKDLAWADSELYHLGPVVAAQQIHEHQ